MKTKVIEVQGRSHTLTMTNGKTFRIFAGETKTIDSQLVSPEFLAEAKAGNFVLVDEKPNEETKKSKKEAQNDV